MAERPEREGAAGSACEWRPPEKNEPGEAVVKKGESRIMKHSGGEDFGWSGVETEGYKSSEDGSWCGVLRRELVSGRFGERTCFDLRYFEVEPGGMTSYERHCHEHVVIVVRGRGTLRLGDDRREPLEYLDTACVAAWEPHQLLNTSGEEPFGFFCLVDRERDRPELL